MTSTYKTVETLEGLEAVRRRPGMYVGSTTCGEGGKNPRALQQIAQEILSNAIDEAIGGYGDEIHLTIHEDQSLTIQDFGRGHPMGEGFDAIIRSATVLHTSGKFDSQMYAISGGQNGVGMKATNALSTRFEVEATTSVGDHYRIVFKQEEILEKSSRKRKEGELTGTRVTFYPDPEIFESIVWDRKELLRKLDNAAYLTPGVKYVLTDEREWVEETDASFSRVFQHDGGMGDLVAKYVGSQERVGPSIHIQGSYLFKGKEDVKRLESEDEREGYLVIDVDCTIQYTSGIQETVVSFANGIPTYEGGPHVDGLKSALSRAFTTYAKDVMSKTGFQPSDTRDGVVCALSLAIPEPLADFEGQMKEKLGTSQARVAVNAVVLEQLTRWLYDHADQAALIIEKMEESKKIRQATQEARAVVQKSRKSRSSLKDRISSKLTRARSQKPEELELFLVEGDSAGGSAKQARNPKTQAILPLRGKPKNIIGMKYSAIVKNEEMNTLIQTLGVSVGSGFDISDLQYHKLIIMADADVDGEHIVALLIGNIWHLFPELVERGHLYIANAPLFRFDRYVKGKPELAFALDQAEYDALLETHAPEDGWRVTRLKGLGEMEYQDLKTTTMDPKTRRLTQVTVEDAVELSEMVDLFLGNRRVGGQTAPERRREWLLEHARFRLEG